MEEHRSSKRISTVSRAARDRLTRRLGHAVAELNHISALNHHNNDQTRPLVPISWLTPNSSTLEASAIRDNGVPAPQDSRASFI
ncbi:hypothetical protein FA13DRAFT_1738635 [Coprinellus micaceus]|uniref:Uncharacterized protein n=1 Tax=Coprinellus micaceus TaxID=71717 RepID=A0A4Y7SU16_COPMI|nr:hypothetical protein FA13DRAFT_1738635 [Coprinellus micaceus]